MSLDDFDALLKRVRLVANDRYYAVLPEPNKPKYLNELIADAESKGAKVVNGLGKQQAGPFVRPSVLYPVTKEMRVWHEEQFGPLCPVGTFSLFVK